MTMTQAEALADIRFRLDEASARFWTDVELRKWINDAVADIARRTETIQSLSTSVSAVAGTKSYDLPASIARVHLIEFVPTGQNQTYPLRIATRQEMDGIWGLNQNQSGSYPSFAVLWGYTGGASTLKMQVFPVPSGTGTFNIYYYSIPAKLATDGTAAATALTVPEGWETLVPLYVESRAKRADRDQTWQLAKMEYEEEITRMAEMLRHWHDQQQFVTNAGGGFVPRWLYDPFYGG